MAHFETYKDKIMPCIQNAGELSLSPIQQQNMSQNEYEEQMTQMHTLRTTLLNCFVSLISGFDSVFFNLSESKQRAILPYIEFIYRYLDRLVMTENVHFDPDTTLLIYELFLDIKDYFKGKVDHLVNGSSLAGNLYNGVSMMQGQQYDEIKKRMLDPNHVPSN